VRFIFYALFLYIPHYVLGLDLQHRGEARGDLGGERTGAAHVLVDYALPKAYRLGKGLSRITLAVQNVSELCHENPRSRYLLLYVYFTRNFLKSQGAKVKIIAHFSIGGPVRKA
jgi:hypothetical protein